MELRGGEKDSMEIVDVNLKAFGRLGRRERAQNYRDT